jgi:hypothetical protein
MQVNCFLKIIGEIIDNTDDKLIIKILVKFKEFYCPKSFLFGRSSTNFRSCSKGKLILLTKYFLLLFLFITNFLLIYKFVLPMQWLIQIFNWKFSVLKGFFLFNLIINLLQNFLPSLFHWRRFYNMTILNSW